MTVEYAIPSRDRPGVLLKKTIPLLLRLGIDRDRITVFVSKGEMVEYRGWLRQFPGIGLEEGALGVGANRNAILRHYPAGTRLVSIDDDMRDLVVRAGDKKLVSIADWEWDDLVETAFSEAERIGSRIWGLYPVPNPFFMKTIWRTSLCYIAAGLYGFWTDPSPDSPLHVTLADKEDFERSLQCYVADGVVLRCEYVSWRTEGYQGAGGMQADGQRTPERILWSAEELVRRFPGLATLNLTKKSGKAEVRLRDRR